MAKKLIFITVFQLLTVVTGYCQKSPSLINVTGVIENNVSDSLLIMNGLDEPVHQIAITENSKVKGYFKGKTGYYQMMLGQEKFPCYFKSGDMHSFSVNMKEFGNTIQFSGGQAAANNYLIAKAKRDGLTKAAEANGMAIQMEEANFIKYNDSIFKAKADLLNNSGIQDDAFIQLEKKSLAIEQMNELVNFPMMKIFALGQKDFKTTSTYPDAFKLTNFNDPDLIQVPGYTMLIQNLSFKLANEKKERNEVRDVFTECLNMIDSLVTNAEVKEHVAFNFGKMALEHTKTPAEYVARYKAIVKDPTHIKVADDWFSQAESTLPGKPSPDFKLKDIAGKEYTLKSFRGKYVYIDVWATWCMPCIGEIPHLKKLESEMHGKDIVFVSICTYDEKSKWEKYLKEKEMSGVQLFSEKTEPFLSKYAIRGIPRFILLDKEGKIINPNVERPSDPALKKVFAELGL